MLKFSCHFLLQPQIHTVSNCVCVCLFPVLTLASLAGLLKCWGGDTVPGMCEHCSAVWDISQHHGPARENFLCVVYGGRFTCCHRSPHQTQSITLVSHSLYLSSRHCGLQIQFFQPFIVTALLKWLDLLLSLIVEYCIAFSYIGGNL